MADDAGEVAVVRELGEHHPVQRSSSLVEFAGRELGRRANARAYFPFSGLCRDTLDLPLPPAAPHTGVCHRMGGSAADDESVPAKPKAADQQGLDRMIVPRASLVQTGKPLDLNSRVKSRLDAGGDELASMPWTLTPMHVCKRSGVTLWMYFQGSASAKEQRLSCDCMCKAQLCVFSSTPLLSCKSVLRCPNVSAWGITDMLGRRIVLGYPSRERREGILSKNCIPGEF